jgi:hypothetical protein
MLGKRLVDAAAPRESEYQIFDGEIPGLALRINPSGRKVYALYYRTSAGRKRTLTLGVHGAITPDQARRLAKERLAEVTRGGNPSGERRRARQAPDVGALVERWSRSHSTFVDPGALVVNLALRSVSRLPK